MIKAEASFHRALSLFTDLGPLIHFPACRLSSLHQITQRPMGGALTNKRAVMALTFEALNIVLLASRFPVVFHNFYYLYHFCFC